MPKPTPGEKLATTLIELHKKIKTDQQDRRDRRDFLPGLPPRNIKNVVPKRTEYDVLEDHNGKTVRVPDLKTKTLTPLINYKKPANKPFKRKTKKPRTRLTALRL